jgi:diguanylate cyclase (GGDEF)-like protein
MSDLESIITLGAGIVMGAAGFSSAIISYRSKLKKSERELIQTKKLNQLSIELVGIDNLGLMLNHVLDYIKDNLEIHYDSANFMLLEGETLTLVGFRDGTKVTETIEQVEKEKYAALQHILETGKFLLVGDTQEHNNWDSSSNRTNNPISSYIGIPLIHEETIIGVLNLNYNTKTDVDKLGSYLSPLLDVSSIVTPQITQTKHKSQLVQLVARDPLTGIYNRRYFYENIEGEIPDNRQREDDQHSIIMMDLDLFKEVNDNYGHSAGDYILQEFSNAVGEELREEDTFARYGGEEFIISLPHTSQKDALEISERIRSKIENLNLTYGDDEINITTSLGVSTINEKDTYNSLIKRADEALYHSKENGGRNCTSYHKDLDTILIYKKR